MKIDGNISKSEQIKVELGKCEKEMGPESTERQQQPEK